MRGCIFLLLPNINWYMSYTLSVADKKLWPYESIAYPNGDISGDIRPILYDTAHIKLLDANKSYSLCYKESKNLSGKKIAYVDIVDMETGVFFSLQVSNIYYIDVFEWQPHIVAKIGKELRYYKDFWVIQKPIEPDGDKWDLTPLWVFDMFLSYDDDYYYPLIFSREHSVLAKIRRFYDYYGYRSYIDPNGWEHFIMMIEDERSTESDPYWYWVDNFVPISEKITLSEDQYVETWELDPYGNIQFTITNGGKYSIDKSTKEMHDGWVLPSGSNHFSFVRAFDDTDADEIVAKSELGYFIIDRNLSSITKNDQAKIVYFKEFFWCLSPSEANAAYPRFLMLKEDDQIVLINEKSEILCGTDLKWEYTPTEATIANNILTVKISDGTIFSYIII